MANSISTYSTREGLIKYRELTDSEIDTAIKSGIIETVKMGKITALHYDRERLDDWCYDLHQAKIEASTGRVGNLP